MSALGGRLRGYAETMPDFEETDDPHYADRRNFYKVEKWSRDGLRVELMLYAGSSLDKARRIFGRATKHRRRVRLTIRQRMRVLEEWPRRETFPDAGKILPGGCRNQPSGLWHCGAVLRMAGAANDVQLFIASSFEPG